MVADTMEELYGEIEKIRAKGYEHIRCQLGFYGGNLDNLRTPEDPVPLKYWHSIH